ncbi:MAG: hypothetical protein ACFFD5_01855 [Candidatus Thorarchaeota archaeon]
MSIRKVGIMTGGGVMLKAYLNCRILSWIKFRNIWYNAESIRCECRMCWDS